MIFKPAKLFSISSGMQGRRKEMKVEKLTEQRNH